jgi:hypothetical protein
MILLITSSSKAQQCACALEQGTGERTQHMATLKAAVKALRDREFDAVVIEQTLVDADPADAEVVLAESGAAIPVVVNFALSNSERLVADVRTALRRRERERAQACREAEAALRSELSEAVTGILLSSQLALATPEVPPAAQVRIRSVYQLAMSMRARLEPAN